MLLSGKFFWHETVKPMHYWGGGRTRPKSTTLREDRRGHRSAPPYTRWRKGLHAKRSNCSSLDATPPRTASGSTLGGGERHVREEHRFHHRTACSGSNSNSSNSTRKGGSEARPPAERGAATLHLLSHGRVIRKPRQRASYCTRLMS